MKKLISLLAMTANFGCPDMPWDDDDPDDLQPFEVGECEGIDGSRGIDHIGTAIGEDCPDGTAGREDFRRNQRCDCNCKNLVDPECRSDGDDVVADTRMCLDFDPREVTLNRSEPSFDSTLGWRREVGSDCGGVSYSGRCASATELEFCEPNLATGEAKLVQVNCQLNTMGCGIDVDLGVADCRRSNELAFNNEACSDDGFAEKGLCVGNNLLRCVNGKVEPTYCAAGEICGWEHVSDKFACAKALELPCAQLEQDEYCAKDSVTSGGHTYEYWAIRSCHDVQNGVGKEVKNCGDKACAAKGGDDGQVDCLDQDDLDKYPTCSDDRMSGTSPEDGGVSFDCGSLGLRCRIFHNKEDLGGLDADDLLWDNGGILAAGPRGHGGDDEWRAYCVNVVTENSDLDACVFKSN